jgi:hypothetical protein
MGCDRGGCDDDELEPHSADARHQCADRRHRSVSSDCDQHQRLWVSVRDNGVETMSGVGEPVIIFRTPQGAQLQVTPVPPEMRRSP